MSIFISGIGNLCYYFFLHQCCQFIIFWVVLMLLFNFLRNSQLFYRVAEWFYIFTSSIWEFSYSISLFRKCTTNVRLCLLRRKSCWSSDLSIPFLIWPMEFSSLNICPCFECPVIPAYLSWSISDLPPNVFHLLLCPMTLSSSCSEVCIP